MNQVTYMRPPLEALLLRRMQDKGFTYESLGKRLDRSKSTIEDRLSHGKLTTIADFEEILDELGLVVIGKEVASRTANPEESIIPTDYLDSLITQAGVGVRAIKEQYGKRGE